MKRAITVAHIAGGMRATHDKAAEGRTLVRVVFERILPDADAPMAEAIYEVDFPDDFRITGDPYALNLLSVTRRDTRQPFEMNEDERRAVLACAINHAASIQEED